MSETPSRSDLTRAIVALGERYLAEGRAPSLYEVNNGLCLQFAKDVAARLGGEDGPLDILEAANFTVEGEGEEWDVALLTEHWPASVPTHGLDWDDVREEIPEHFWLVMEGRHYDAECPEGVDNLFELPLLRRGMENIAERKAAAAPGP